MRRKLAAAASLAASCAALLLRWPRRADAPKTIAPRSLLVLGYAAVGDLLFFLPALRALRAAYPQARIVFIGDRDVGTSELLPGLGLVDEIWAYPHSRLAEAAGRREIFRRIRAAKFDAVVTGLATPMRAFAQAILAIPLRIGHCRPISPAQAGWTPARLWMWRLRRGLITGEFERRLSFNAKVWVREELEHSARRNARLLEPLGIDASRILDEPPPLPESPAERDFAQAALAPASGKRVLAVHLGSSQSQYAKIWTPEKWAQACRALTADSACALVLIGGPDEASAVARFRAAFGGEVLDLTGRARFLETCALLRRCALLLSADTGPAKAAMVLGIPTVTVWGPTSRADNGALWNPERHAEISLGLPCSPCVAMALPREGPGVLNFMNCGHHDCLGTLGPAAVTEAVRALTKTAGAPIL